MDNEFFYLSPAEQFKIILQNMNDSHMETEEFIKVLEDAVKEMNTQIDAAKSILEEQEG